MLIFDKGWEVEATLLTKKGEDSSSNFNIYTLDYSNQKIFLKIQAIHLKTF